ncbi:MAG: hypothetical protein JST54_09385 [Deltaproteobacteria bacterium]|nr:hypothetical protein [Deltaproteobacteria bacterium]
MKRALASIALATGLLVSATSFAQATDSTTGGLAPAPTESAPSSGGGNRHLGARMTLSLANDMQGSLGYLNVHGNSGFELSLGPALDFFPVEHLSAGAVIRFNVVSFNSNTNVFFGIEPRVGYAFQVAPNITLWPRGGLEIDSSSSTLFTTLGGSTGGGVIFGFDADMPILFGLGERFYIGFGPAIHTEFTGDIKSNFVGFQFYLGGWVGPF